MSRAALLHLPLLLPLCGYGLALALRGAPAAGAYAASLFTLVFVVGIPLCVWLHLLAGRTLLTDASALKRYLAGGVIADEAALLVYAPAVGLLGTLLLAIAGDFALRDAVLRGRADLALPFALAALALAALAIFKSRALCDRDLHRILPRFAEFDVPPPFRDDGVRRVVPGERLAPALPAAARPMFLRDLRQLRRRYRLDRVLLWLYAAALLRMDLADDAPAPLASHLVALAALVGLALAPAFRLAGRTLASPWLERSFPVDAAGARVGRLAASSIYPLWALLITAVVPLVAGAPALAAAALGLGLPLVAALLLASQALAALAYPDRVFAAATAWRALVIALLGGALWLMAP